MEEEREVVYEEGEIVEGTSSSDDVVEEQALLAGKLLTL